MSWWSSASTALAVWDIVAATLAHTGIQYTHDTNMTPWYQKKKDKNKNNKPNILHEKPLILE